MRFLLVWTLLSAMAGVIAWGKGRSHLLFFGIALVFSPPVGIIAALIVPKKNAKASPHSAATRPCPHCGGDAPVTAAACPKCGAGLPPIIDAGPSET